MAGSVLQQPDLPQIPQKRPGSPQHFRIWGAARFHHQSQLNAQICLPRMVGYCLVPKPGSWEDSKGKINLSKLTHSMELSMASLLLFPKPATCNCEHLHGDENHPSKVMEMEMEMEPHLQHSHTHLTSPPPGPAFTLAPSLVPPSI